MYCYCCRQFNTTIGTGHNLSSPHGYKDRKHISNLLIEHDNRQSKMNYVTRMKATGRLIEDELSSQHNSEVSYWTNVVRRIVAVVKFLASIGLPYREDNETFESQNIGNHLRCLELISEFDPFLADHIQNYGNRGKGSISYLSDNISNEFNGRASFKTIVKELKSAKYY